MPKLSEQSRERLRYAARHPVQWMRGDGLPEEIIRPWEQAAHIVPNLFTGLRNGFTWNAMFMYQEVFKLDKRQQVRGDLIKITFDGLNDPLIGAFMDSRNYSIRAHRFIMRLGILLRTLLLLVPMLDLGLTSGQRIAVYIVFNCLADVFGTPASISQVKILAHISPDSGQRSRAVWAKGVGIAVHEMLLPVSVALAGMYKFFGWSQHSIYLVGAVALSIPALFLEMAPSFTLQRVPDKPQTQTAGMKELARDLKESLVLMRHNRYLLLDFAQRVLTSFTPGMDDRDFYNYCGVDKLLKTKAVRGETVVFLRDNIASVPCNALVPFAMPIIKKLGGARNTQVVYQCILTVCNLLKWLVGMNSLFGIFFSWFMEILNRVFAKVQMIAEEMIKFDMFDYVEWKTGRRSEGVMHAFSELTNKIITANLDKAVGSLTIDALGFDPGLKKQPAAFIKWAPVLYLLVPAADSLIALIARILYKYPEKLKRQVEADLIERRALAEAMINEVAQETASI